MIQKEELILESMGLNVNQLREQLVNAICDNNPECCIVLAGADCFVQKNVLWIKKFLTKNGWVVKETTSSPRYNRFNGKAVLIDMRASLCEE